MMFPFFASFIVFCAWLAYHLHRSRRMEERQYKNFWDLEMKANNTRRKPLDDLVYIHIPFETLPMKAMSEDFRVAECHETLHTLTEDPIVNFTGISNTDLKLRYGAPNINLLTEYDQRYTVLVRTLQKWAEILYASGYQQEARVILEFAVSTGTDVSHSYFLLADIYKELGTPEKISELIPVTEQLNSPLSSFITRKLKESCEPLSG